MLATKENMPSIFSAIATSREGMLKFIRKGTTIVVSQSPWTRHVDLRSQFHLDTLDDAGSLFANPVDNSLDVMHGSVMEKISEDNPQRPTTVQMLQELAEGSGISIRKK